MKKKAKFPIHIYLIGIVIIFGLFFLIGRALPPEEPKLGQPTPTPEIKTEEVLVEEKERFTVLSGIEKDPSSDAYGELVIQEINIWEKAGAGGPNNMAIGTVPHNTKVKVLESREADGVTFYHIQSSIGKVSVLPTDFALRKKKMEELPENEWFSDASENNPVDGWVTDSFVTEITED